MKFLKTNSGRVLSAKDSPIMRRWKRETKRYLSKGLRFKTATFQTRGEDQRKDEDSRAGDPSYFISRWYITPCHAPSSLEYICVYIRRFAFPGSTSQPGRLTRWKNKGEAGGGGWEGTLDWPIFILPSDARFRGERSELSVEKSIRKFLQTSGNLQE